MHYLFKNLLLFTRAKIRQTESIVLMTKEECTKIVNSISHGVGVLVLGRGHIVNMHISSLLVYTWGYSGDCSGLWASCFSIPGHLGQIIFVHGNNKNDIRDTYMLFCI